MKKLSRHNKILELVENKSIETQYEIAVELIALGYKVTQATISRDIKELSLVKIPTDEGLQRYARAKDRSTAGGKFATIMRDIVLKTTLCDNQIIIKTVDGFGKAAKSILQSISDNSGCLADDDTVFIIFKEQEQAAVFYKKIKEFVY